MTKNKRRKIRWANVIQAVHNSKVQIRSQVGSVFTLHFFGIKGRLDMPRMANMIVDTVLRLPERSKNELQRNI